MRRGQRIVPQPVCDRSTPLDQFIHLTADSLEAYSAVLLAVDEQQEHLRILAYYTSSDRFIADVTLPVESSIPGEIFRKGMPVYEACFTGTGKEIGFYAHRPPVTSYVAVPVGSWALLWVDTSRVAGFSARHLRLVLQLALIAEAIPQLSEMSEHTASAANKIEFFEGLLKTEEGAPFNIAPFLDNLVNRLVANLGLEGAVIGVVDPERGLLKVLSCAGFSALMERGRVVRLKRGWTKWALENERTVIITGQRSGEGPLTLFHAGENLGFEPKALVVVPWSEIDEMNRGVLAVASRRQSQMLEENRDTWQFLAKLVGLLRSMASREAFVKGMRRYDSESGVLNETGFHQQVKAAFLRSVDRKGTLFLFLTEISNMDELYLSVDHIVLRRFLEIYVDKLRILTKRSAVIGKFKSGGFGMAVENMPSDEAISLTKKAASLVETGVTVVDGYQIYYRACFASASFPSEAHGLRALWKKARDGLAQGASLTVE